MASYLIYPRFHALISETLESEKGLRLINWISVLAWLRVAGVKLSKGEGISACCSFDLLARLTHQLSGCNYNKERIINTLQYYDSMLIQWPFLNLEESYLAASS